MFTQRRARAAGAATRCGSPAQVACQFTLRANSTSIARMSAVSPSRRVCLTAGFIANRSVMSGRVAKRKPRARSPVDDQRQRLGRLHPIALGIVAVAVVQEKDRSRAQPLERARARSRPAPGRAESHTPSDQPTVRWPSERAMWRDPRAAEAVRGAEVVAAARPEARTMASVPRVEVVAHVAGCPAMQLAVPVAVVAELVSLVGHPRARAPASARRGGRERRRSRAPARARARRGCSGVASRIGAVVEGDARRRSRRRAGAASGRPKTGRLRCQVPCAASPAAARPARPSADHTETATRPMTL